MIGANNTKVGLFFNRKFAIILFTVALGLVLMLPSAAFSADDTWEQAGNITDQVKPVPLSPYYQNDETVFAGSSSGVYRSTDRGRNFCPVNTGLTNTTVRSIAISPNFTTDNTVFVGTMGGVFKTTNGGKDYADPLWVPKNSGLSTTDILSIMVSPGYNNAGSDKIVFAGTNNAGVFKSTDGGENWSAANTGISISHYMINDIALSPNFSSDGIAFACTNGGVYKSTNYGASWTLVNSGLTTHTNIKSIAVSHGFAADGMVFIGVYGGGVYKSVDSGQSWSPVNNGITNLNVLAVALTNNFPGKDGVVIAGTSTGVFRSRDQGDSWDEVNNGLLHRFVLNLHTSPCYCLDRNVYAGTESGVYMCVFSDILAPITTLTSVPISPDGDDGTWFKTRPTISLNPDEPGYTYYEWDQDPNNPSTTWTTYDEITKITGLEGNHTLYYYSTDAAGNIEDYHSIVIKVDIDNPSDPTSVVSTSHTISVPSGDNTIDMSISGASDVPGSSGVDGYSIEWSNSATTLPNNVKDIDVSVTSVTSPALAYGNWYFHLRTKDLAGNWTSTVHVGPFIIDASPPTTSITPVDTSNWFTEQPTILLTRSESGTTYYKWDNNSNPDTWPPYSSSPVTVTGLTQGTHTLYYYSKDSGGNPEILQNKVFKLDMSGPAAFDLISPAGGASIDNATPQTFSWQASSDADSGFDEYELYIDDVLAADNLTTNTYALSESLSIDNHTWYVKAFDNAGNSTMSTPVLVNFQVVKLDNVPPDAFNLISPAEGAEVGNTTPQTFSWQASLDADSGIKKYQLYIDGSLKADNLTTNTYTLSTSLSVDNHSWYVKAFDNAGNSTMSTPALVNFQVNDTSLPTTSINPANPAAWYTSPPTISLSRNESGTTYYKWDDSSNPDTWPPYSSSSVTVTGLTQGTHTLYYYSKDSSGNIELLKNKVFRLDTITPAAFNLISPAGGASLDNDVPQTFSWQASSDAGSGIDEYELYIDDALAADNLTTNTYTLPTSLSVGDHRWYVKTFDNAGNLTMSTPTLVYFRVNDAVPPVTYVSPASSRWYSYQPLIKIYITHAEQGTTYYSWNSSTGPWTTYTDRFPALDGQNTLYFYSVDIDGNTEVVKSQVFKVDQEAPGPFDLISPPDGEEKTNDTKQTFQWEASVDEGNSGIARYILYVDDKTYKSSITSTSYTTTTSLSSGDHTWYVVAVDGAGNKTSSSSTFNLTITDVIPPKTTISSGTTNWTSEPSDVKLTSNESGSEIYYSWNSASGPWTLYTDPFQPEEGDNTLYAYSVDPTGNEENPPKSKVVKVDIDQPSAFDIISPSEGSTLNSNEALTFTWNSSADVGDSGLSKYILYVDGSVYRSSLLPTSTSYQAYKMLSVGDHSWYMEAVDRAGNVTGSDSTFNFTVKDNVAPVTTLSTHPVSYDGNSGWFKTTPSVYLTRNEPGTSYYQWNSTSGTWISYESLTSGLPGVEGQNTLYYYSEDSDGNNESVKSTAFKIDKSAPISIITSPVDGANLSGTSCAITGTASDPSPSSGIKKVEISIDGGSWVSASGTSSWSYLWALPTDGNHTIKSRVTDNAGNVETATITEISANVDNTEPMIVSVDPAGSATNVNVGSIITAVFTELMNPASINTSTFSLKDSANNPVDGTVSYNSTTRTATFRPSSPLNHDETYTATITTGVTDMSGRPIAAGIVWAFSTTPSTSAPFTILSTEPESSNENGWFTVIPSISLEPDIPGVTYYQWWNKADNLAMSALTAFGGPFDAPEGEYTLHYYSVANSMTENVQKAAFNIDAHAPTPPSTVEVSACCYQAILLSWHTSSDNIGVVGYNIYNASTNELIGSSTTNSYTVTGLQPQTHYSFYIGAYDAAGNISPASNTVSETTLKAPVKTDCANVPLDLGGGIIVEYDDDVVEEGNTSAKFTEPVDTISDPGLMYRGYHVDISTTASYTGTVTITMYYDDTKIDGNEEDLKLMHKDGNKWVDITTERNTDENWIKGKTTSLSPFELQVYGAGSGGGSGGSAVPSSSTWSLILMGLIAIGILGRKSLLKVRP